MEGWVDLGYPAMHQPGVELAIFRSVVRRPNHYTTEPCFIMYSRNSIQFIEAVGWVTRRQQLLQQFVSVHFWVNILQNNSIRISLLDEIEGWCTIAIHLNSVSQLHTDHVDWLQSLVVLAFIVLLQRSSNVIYYWPTNNFDWTWY